MEFNVFLRVSMTIVIMNSQIKKILIDHYKNEDNEKEGFCQWKKNRD